MKRKTRFLAALLAMGMVFTAMPETAMAAKKTKKAKTNGNVTIQLMTVNDVHGQITSSGSVRTYGGKKIGLGGPLSVLSTYLNAAEKDFKKKYKKDAVSFRIQSGDMVGASEAASGLLQDEPVMRSLKKMKFKLGTLGNHEFDEGLDEFNRVLKGLSPEKGQFGEVVDAYPHEDTEMEIVIANVKNKSDGKVPFGWKPYTVKKFKDKQGDVAKVGFIGVVTEEIPVLVLKKQWESYDITSPAEAINKYAKVLRKKGVKAIVVLGHTAAATDMDNGTTLTEETQKIIDGLDKKSSVDIFVAGHNHVITNAVYKGVRVVEGASHAKAFGNIVAEYNVKKKDFTKVTAEVVPALTVKFNDDGTSEDLKVEKDPVIAAIEEDAQTRIASIINKEIAKGESTIKREKEFKETDEAALKSPANLESDLGNLITDGQLAFARQNGFPEASFAVTNNGGIRADLEVTTGGAITWGAAQKVQPFGNVMQVIEISGKDLKDALNSQYDTNETYFLQIAGLSYTYKDAPADLKDDKGNPVKYVVDEVFVVDKDGKKEKVSDDKMYSGVINDFLYGGGDGFAELAGKKLLGALDPDTEIFVWYLGSLGNVKVKSGDRKVYVK